MTTERYLEDYHAGEVVRAHGVTVSEADIIEFAFRYDPQPFHLDVGAAKESLYGGLIASGFQTLAVTFRLFFATGITGHNMGGKGLKDLRWLHPVRPVRTDPSPLSLPAPSHDPCRECDSGRGGGLG